MAAVEASGARLPKWGIAALGVVLIIAGFVVLGDVVTATVVSTVFIGVCAVVAGLFEIVHAFWSRGWGSFLWRILLGLLYVAGGVSLMTSPMAGALTLTYVLGLVLLISGLLRIYMGFRSLRAAGGLLLLSGLFGVLAGLLIIFQWPYSGLWVIGTFLGIDLIIHGAGWLALGFTSPKLARVGV